MLRIVSQSNVSFDDYEPYSIDEGVVLTWWVSHPWKTYDTTYYYRVSGIDADDGNMSSGRAFTGSFLLDGDRFSNINLGIKTLKDHKTEGPETIRFEISKDANYRNIVASNSTVLNDISKKISITAASEVNEGNVLTWHITNMSDINGGYIYRISGAENIEDQRLNSPNNNIVRIKVPADQQTEGPETIKLELFAWKDPTKLLAASANTIVNDTSKDPEERVSAPSAVNEGDSLKWNISDLILNQYYYYRITGIGVPDTSDALTGNFGTGSSSTRNISITTLSDQKTEGNETIKFELFKDRSYTNLAATATTTLKDTSTTPVITVTGPSESAEGDVLNWSLRGMVANQYYYYRITGIDNNDTQNRLSGSFRQSSYGSSTRNISITTLADKKTEGDEKIKFDLFTDSNYTNLAASSTTTLKDTSTKPVITVTAPSEISEGNDLNWSLSGMGPNQYYYRITGIDKNDAQNRLSGSFRQSRYDSSTRNISITARADKKTEGDEKIKFELFADSNYTDLAASSTTTLKDTSITPAAEITGPNKINEGDNGTFIVKNIPTGSNYYYRFYDPTGNFLDSDVSGNLTNTISSRADPCCITARSIIISLTADHDTEGPEQATFELHDNSTFAGEPIVSKKFTINDTSTDQSKLTYGSYSSQKNPSVVNEGENLSFNLSNLVNTTYYWKFEGIDSEDISGKTSGQFRSYRGGSRQIPFNIKSDDLTEGVENVVFTLSKDKLFSKTFKSATFSIADTSQDPKTAVDFTSSRIRSNEGESAKIDLSISSFPRNTTNLYWELSGSGLTKDDLATRFGDLSGLIDLKNHYFGRMKYIRGTEYHSGSYSFNIPFSSDKTTEGTETYQLKIYDKQSLKGRPLAASDVIVYDTSLDSPKSNLNTATLENKTINLYFSAPIDSRDISPSYFEIKSQNKNLAVDSVNLNDSKNAARITLRTEPDLGSKVDIIYKSSSKSILQSFEETVQVNDVVTPVPISGIAYADRIELRFSEKLNSTQLARSTFEIRASKRVKKIESIDVMGDDGMVIIKLQNNLDINDNSVEVDYYDLSGNQSSGVLEDYSGNDVGSFRRFAVTNEVSDTEDISVVLAEADESIITLGFDIEIDENSVPNTGMFRVSINGNKSKVQSIQLSAKKREAYLELKNPISNGDVVNLTYIDAKGNQKDNIIQSKYGGDLGTFKNLYVDNLSSISFDPPDIEEAYYDDELSAITLEFDEIISGSKIKNSRFKVYSLNKSGKKKRSKVSDVISYEEDTIVEIMLKRPIEPSAQQLFVDYRDPKGDQKRGVIEDLQGNDLLSVKQIPVELG